MSAQKKQVRPTKKQRQMLLFVDQFIQEHGYSPSYREIMSGLGYSSIATVSLHINNLIARGHIRKRDYSARSLEVVAETEMQKPITTNQIKPAEEKWLVERVEHFFNNVESDSAAPQSKLDELYVLIGSLKVLGLDGAANSFIPRLSDLKQKSSNA